MPSGTLSFSGCPFKGSNFSQEAWVLRCLRWEEGGPHRPAFLEQAHNIVTAAKLQIERNKQLNLRAAGGR